jgi:hypothetical protein
MSALEKLPHLNPERHSLLAQAVETEGVPL